MITILNGKLTIPESERFIGFAGDNLRRTIEFMLSGADEADRIYRLYLTFDDGTVNYFVLPSQLTDEGVVLTWQVLREHIFMSGCVKAQIKAFSDTGVVYHTTTDRFFVGDSAEFSDYIENNNTEFLQYEQRLNELAQTVSDICVLMPFVGENGNWYIYDADKGEYIDSGNPSVGIPEITDGSVTSQMLSDGAIDRLSLFSADMIAKYMSLPVYAYTVVVTTESLYNTLTNEGIYKVDDQTGIHQVVVVLKPTSDAHLMQIRLSYNKIEYRGIWCTVDGVYADEDWEDWKSLVTTVDSEFDSDSENPLQNKAIFEALSKKMSKAEFFGLAKSLSDTADPQLIAYQNTESSSQEMLRVPLSVIIAKIKAFADTGEYFVSENVDGALQEIGASISSLSADLVKLNETPTALVTAHSGLLSNINDNLIFTCSASFGWKDMPTTAGVIFVNCRYGTNYNIQLAIVQSTGVIWTRVINRNTHEVYRDWVSANDNCLQYRSVYTTQAGADSVENKLVNILDVGSFAIASGHYTDVPADYPPSGAGTIINAQVSGNYGIQFLMHHTSGLMWNRIVNRSTKTVHRDWTLTGTDARMKVLALGDSICRGVRNSEKGFVGDLGLPYKNIGVSSATISNAVTTVINIPDQLVNLSTSEPDYSPDIIIGEGGINDWSQSANLGAVSAVPVSTDEEAEALDRSTVMGGLEYLFYKMITLYPKAQRFFLITHKTYKTNADAYCPATENNAGWTQQDLHDAVVECCNAYNVKVIDVYKDSMINTAFAEYRSDTAYNDDNTVTDTQYVDYDGVHPLAYGYKEGYVPLIKKAIGIGTVK